MRERVSHTESGGGGVRALARGLEILSLFGDGPAERTQSEIAAALALPLPTVHRLCRTLVDHGFLARVPDTRQLRPGLRILRLAAPLLDGMGVSDIAVDHLRGLAVETGETVNLATLDGAEVVYLTSARGNRLLAAHASVGMRVPAHCTALGKCLLSQLPDAEVRARLGDGPYERRTPQTLASWRALAPALAAARAERLVVSDEEYEVGLVSLAVPVRALGEGRPGAVNLSLPAARASAETRTQLGRGLLAMAGAIDAATRLIA